MGTILRFDSRSEIRQRACPRLTDDAETGKALMLEQDKCWRRFKRETRVETVLFSTAFSPPAYTAGRLAHRVAATWKRFSATNHKMCQLGKCVQPIQSDFAGYHSPAINCSG